jgi:hypothetical protein
MDSIIIFMFLAIIIVGSLLLAVIFLTRKGPKVLNQAEYRSKWLKIESSIDDNESSRQLAIINADKLLDYALKQRGVKGNTIAQRMKNSKNIFRNNNAVWAAHKLRNKIAHEDSVKIQPKTTKQALTAYKMALKDVGAL